MTLIQWNSNGFYSHLAELQNIIAQTNPEFICLQETRFNRNKITTLKGYTVYQKNREDYRIASGGVAIFTANNIFAEEIPLQTDLEAIAITTYAPTKITICNIYLAPDLNFDLRQLHRLAIQLPTPYLILGDFNGHNTLWGSRQTDRKGRIIEEFIDDHLILLNDGTPTHFCARTGTLSAIDLSLCTPTLATRVTWEVLQHYHGSDHFPIKINFRMILNKNNKLPGCHWNMKKADWCLYQNLLKINTSQFTETENIDKIVEDFTNQILDAANGSIKQRQISKLKKATPWWNNECARTVQENKSAFNRYKKHKTMDNFITFKKTRAIARKTITQSKANSWREYVSTITSSTPLDEVWGKIRRIKGAKTTRGISTLIHGSKIISSPQEIANHIANNFQYHSSNEKYDKNFLTYKTTCEQQQIDIQHDDSPINNQITLHELEIAINELKDNRCPGPDSITFEMIKYLPLKSVLQLLQIYNTIWLKHVYPTQWKKVITVPIPKQYKNKTNADNYRPIAISNTLNKVLQKIINKRLIWHLESNNIFNNIQCGFRKGRSTTNHIVKVTSDINYALANKQDVIAVFFDLEKAYDMVWKFYILKCLKEHGLNGNIIQYINNFFTDRKFTVRVNGYLSDEKLQTNGIPQGEILSVTLFLIAVNNITNFLPDRVYACLFADDLAIYYKGKNINTITLKIQNTLLNLEEWSKITGFKFSTLKTKAMLFTRKRNLNRPTLKLYQQNIEYVDKLKFLGVTLDNKLNWSHHIVNLKKECFQRLNILKILGHHKWGAQKEVLLNLYRSLIRSKIDYGCISYGIARPTILKKLDSIHNTAVRISTGAFCTSPVRSLLCEAGEMPLHYRRQQLTMSHIINLARNPNIPSYDHFFSNKLNQLNSNNLSPILKNVTEALSRWKISLPIISKTTFNQIPPWSCKRPNFNLTLTKYKKSETTSQQFQQIFFELNCQYENHKEIYTDGSHHDNKTGAAWVIGGDIYKYHLPDNASNFTAEMYSLLKVSEYINGNHSDNRYIIYTDSLSAIQAIQQLFTSCTITQQIQDNFHRALSNGKNIVLAWIPAHVGLAGNTRADEAAKDAVNVTETILLIPPNDVLHKVKIAIKEDWTNVWQNTTSNQLRNIKPTTENWPLCCQRKEQIAITRLRIGHTRLTHKHLLQRSEPEVCVKCNVPISVTHILVNCQNYSIYRQKYNLPANLREILKNESNKTKDLIKFLKKTDLISEI